MVVTKRDLLDHLIDQYGNITAANLKANKARINKALGNSRPIDVFFNASMTLYSMTMMEKPIYGEANITDGISPRQRHQIVSGGMQGMAPEIRPRQKVENFQAPLCR